MESVFSTSLVWTCSDWQIVGGQQIFLLNRFLIFIEQANGFSKHSLWVPPRMSCFHGWLKSQKWLRSLDRRFRFVANEWDISAFFFPFPLYFISLRKALYVSSPTTHKALCSVIHSLLVSIFLSTTFSLLVPPPTAKLGLRLAHVWLPTSPSHLFQMFQAEAIQTLRHYNKVIEEMMFLHCFTWFHLCSIWHCCPCPTF